MFLHRAGFDSFEVSKEPDAADFAEAVLRYSVFYQPSADGRRARSGAARRPQARCTFRRGDALAGIDFKRPDYCYWRGSSCSG